MSVSPIEGAAAPAVVSTPDACRRACNDARAAGRTVGLVPTMGFLHEGHAALMREARRRCDFLVVSIFVNPAQFGPAEDLDRYPRDLAGDLALCGAEGVALVYAPERPEVVYPPGFQTWVEVTDVTRHLCGAARPGHFRGVTTVVSKLFNLVRPDVAVFGEKDYQQLVAIRTMARDLDMGVEVLGLPTVREPDGLAMSSRNANLGPAARRRAPGIQAAIAAGREAFAAGERRAGTLRALIRGQVEAAVDRVDYVELSNPQTLEPLDGDQAADATTRVLVAAFYDTDAGRVRLIDNGPLGEG